MSTDIKDLNSGVATVTDVVIDTADSMSIVINTLEPLPGISTQVTEIHTVVKSVERLMVRVNLMLRKLHY